jgi:hypothetical protein
MSLFPSGREVTDDGEEAKDKNEVGRQERRQKD